MDGYEATRFDVTQLTQDVEQSQYYKRLKGVVGNVVGVIVGVVIGVYHK